MAIIKLGVAEANTQSNRHPTMESWIKNNCGVYYTVERTSCIINIHQHVSCTWAAWLMTMQNLEMNKQLSKINDTFSVFGCTDKTAEKPVLSLKPASCLPWCCSSQLNSRWEPMWFCGSHDEFTSARTSLVFNLPRNVLYLYTTTCILGI